MLEESATSRGGRASAACTCTSASRAPTAATSASKPCWLAPRRARAVGQLAVRRRPADRNAVEPCGHPRAAPARRCAAGVRGTRREAWVERLVELGVLEDSHAHLVGRSPAPALGTLEIRIADQPTSLERTALLVGLVRELVEDAPARGPTAATTSRTAGPPRATASTRSSSIRTASGWRGARARTRAARHGAARARGADAARRGRRRRGPRRADGSLTADGDRDRDDPGQRHPLRALREPARGRAQRPRRPRGREREPHGPGHARVGRRADHRATRCSTRWRRRASASCSPASRSSAGIAGGPPLVVGKLSAATWLDGRGASRR